MRDALMIAETSQGEYAARRAMARRRRIVSFCCLFLVPAWARANITQPIFERQSRNTLYLELLGSGGVYSFNYERFVGEDVTLRLGVGYLNVSASSTSGTAMSASVSMLTIPVTASYLGVRSGNHALELGGGAVIVNLSGRADSADATAFASGTGVGGTAIVGYRYAPVEGGFNFRLALTPIFGAGGFLPWAGIAFGCGL